MPGPQIAEISKYLCQAQTAIITAESMLWALIQLQPDSLSADKPHILAITAANLGAVSSQMSEHIATVGSCA